MFWAMLRLDPSQKCHPDGAKVPAKMRISPTKFSILKTFLDGGDAPRGSRPAGVNAVDGDHVIQGEKRLQIGVRKTAPGQSQSARPQVLAAA